MPNCKTTGLFQPSHCRGLLYDAIHGWMTGRMMGRMVGRMDGRIKGKLHDVLYYIKLVADLVFSFWQIARLQDFFSLHIVSNIIISVVSVCPVSVDGSPFHPSVPSSVHPSSSSRKKKMMEESTTIKKLVSAS